MKHRHKLSQRQRQRPAPLSRRLEVDKTADEQPRSIASKLKKSSMHSMRAEGGRTKLRLDKFRRGGRRTKRFDDGGAAAGSTRPNDPGNEIAGAGRRDRPKGALERLGRELIGPRVGLQARRPTAVEEIRRRRYGSPAKLQCASPAKLQCAHWGRPRFSAKPNPIVAMVQSEMPPVDTVRKGYGGPCERPPDSRNPCFRCHQELQDPRQR